MSVAARGEMLALLASLRSKWGSTESHPTGLPIARSNTPDRKDYIMENLVVPVED